MNFLRHCRYEIILDCCQQGPDTIQERGYPHNTYITLNPPMLKNFDEYGLIGGSFKNASNLLKHNIPRKDKGNMGTVKWGFFAPSRTGMNMIQELVENERVCTNNFHKY